MSMGSSLEPTPGWNRLATINNGQGGKLTFSYEHVWLLAQNPAGENYVRDYANYYRLTQSLAQDLTGTGKSTLTTYSYSTPLLNDEQTAATVFYAHYPPSLNGDSRTFLGHPEKREFRGHASVTEQHYDGATTAAALLQEVRHRFYQGDAGCLPTISNNMVSESDACFVQLVARESWKGKEYQTTIWNAGGSNPLQLTSHTFGRTELPFYGDASTAGPSNHYKRVGLWRAFNPEIQLLTQDYEGGSTSVDQKTTYAYDQSGYQSGGPYGNLTSQAEYDGTTLVRTTEHFYDSLDTTASYLVDRPWADDTRDSAGRLLALTQYFYDGQNTTANTVGTKGELTRVAKYYDVPLAANAQNVTLHGQDVTYTYDAYGNRLTETTYAQAGTRLYTGSSWAISAPGNGSTARSSTTGYDGVFHIFPTSFSNALSHSQTAGYDYRMGTLTSVTDANNATTTASYDAFGRLLTLVKPGDSASYPTVQAYYGDGEQPFRYQLAQREQAGTTNARYSQTFYDGLGRQIQTKQEGPGGWQNIVVDMRYDGLNRVAGQSQARYSNENGTSFWQWTNPGASLYRPTATSYDALGRVLSVSAPDGTTPIRKKYWVGPYGTAIDVYDANNHVAVQHYDLRDRLRQVYEYQGNNGSEGGYTNPVGTSYAYSALDLLTQVTDANGNVTSISYDTLGRKTGMSDPDMGVWSYAYDPNGNLTRQTDARGQRICFYYDALDRLTGKHYRGDDACPASPPIAVAYYYDQGANGKGRRTGMQNWNVLVLWQFDARGRKTQADYQVAANGGISRSFHWYYNSADQLIQLNYPNTNGLGYSYDAAGRPYAVCSWYGCIVRSASYTALDQPAQWQGDHGRTDSWSYNDAQARLTHTTVGSGNRDYTYDAVGNLTTIVDNIYGQTQNFTYDHRDRLTHAWTTGSAGYPGMAYDISTSYDALGNLSNKSDVGSYSYGSSGAGTGSGPHQARTVGGATYSYDANGNLLSGGGRSYSWNEENQLASVSSGGVTETYGYDPDGERVLRTRQGTTTVTRKG